MIEIDDNRISLKSRTLHSDKEMSFVIQLDMGYKNVEIYFSTGTSHTESMVVALTELIDAVDIARKVLNSNRREGCKI